MELSLNEILETCLQAREAHWDAATGNALRLFNGFYEGYPNLVADVYGGSLVLFDYAPTPQPEVTRSAAEFYLSRLPGLECVIVKERSAPDPATRRGRIIHGSRPDTQVDENGVIYAIDLLLNQDASFYLDTRGLRSWARGSLAGKRVLNTFAYTGSLGVAAAAGGAQVQHLDRSAGFIELAKASHRLNNLPVDASAFIAADFFPFTSRLRRQGDVFDCVFVDPPYLSSTSRGRVDLVNEHQRLLNKARPLVADGGWLVAINNSLFLPGSEYLAALENLCSDGYLEIETLVPVPPDVTGYPATIRRTPPADPAPFNHPTKIAILKVHKKN